MLNLKNLKAKAGEAPAQSPVTSASVAEPTTPAPAVKKIGSLTFGAKKPAAPVSPPSQELVPVAPVEDVVGETEAEPKTKAESFQAMLDKFDALVVASGGVNVLTLDTARHYVRDIYHELKANPELDPIFVDRDMHNVMAFVQRSSVQAMETIQKKKSNSETRAANKAAKSNTSFDLSAFGDPNAVAQLMSPTQVAVAKAQQAGDALAAFASLDTSALAAKMEKGKAK